jgi:hypothetical protein
MTSWLMHRIVLSQMCCAVPEEYRIQTKKKLTENVLL